MTAALEVGEWSAARPGRTLSPGKTWYPLYRGLGGPQGRSGRAENLVSPGFDPRTVQPLVSRYTDWATRPTSLIVAVDISFEAGELFVFEPGGVGGADRHMGINLVFSYIT